MHSDQVSVPFSGRELEFGECATATKSVAKRREVVQKDSQSQLRNKNSGIFRLACWKEGVWFRPAVE